MAHFAEASSADGICSHHQSQVVDIRVPSPRRESSVASGRAIHRRRLAARRPPVSASTSCPRTPNRAWRESPPRAQATSTRQSRPRALPSTPGRGRGWIPPRASTPCGRLAKIYGERRPEMAELITSEIGAPISFAQRAQVALPCDDDDAFCDVRRVVSLAGGPARLVRIRHPDPARARRRRCGRSCRGTCRSSSSSRS